MGTQSIRNACWSRESQFLDWLRYWRCWCFSDKKTFPSLPCKQFRNQLVCLDLSSLIPIRLLFCYCHTSFISFLFMQSILLGFQSDFTFDVAWSSKPFHFATEWNCSAHVPFSSGLELLSDYCSAHVSFGNSLELLSPCIVSQWLTFSQ